MIEVMELATAFHQAKGYLVEHVGLAKDALHIYVSLFVFFTSCAIFRWSASSWKPWLIVLVAASLGEVLDWQHSQARELPIIMSYHWTDLWNTMLVPTLLVLAARYTAVFKGPVRKRRLS